MLRDYLGLSRWCSFNKYLHMIARKHEMHVQSFAQWKFIFDENGDQLVDFVGTFENLQSDFEKVAQKIGLENTGLPHDMKTNRRKHYTRYYRGFLIRFDGESFFYVFFLSFENDRFAENKLLTSQAR